MTEKVYSAVLNGADLGLFEFKLIINLIEEGLTDKEIRDKILNENLFQKKESSTKRSLPYILKRARTLDEKMRHLVLNETNQMAKQINFYAVMKNDLLFFEFMDEFIKSKLQNNDLIYEKKDLNLFFNEKADQSDQIDQWSEVTVSKLKGVYNRLLINMGYLDNIKSSALNRIYLDESLKIHLIQIGEKKYVEAMEG
ncbi:DUF1819 family protein [Aerococcus urinaeequi]|uniref:DUF1819 family protein n=1 Tax=Aerococcus urinaeequi TaxID=51665 RepID=UPI000845D36C|nr:DUF1819 family protein [Aerococcus urinaeequi]